MSNPLATIAAAPVAVAFSTVLSRVVAPRVGIVAIDADGASRDPAIVDDYRRDPLNFHGRLPARTVGEVARDVTMFDRRSHRINIPTYIGYSSTDPIAPPAGSRRLAENIASTDLTLRDWNSLSCHGVVTFPSNPRRRHLARALLSFLDRVAESAHMSVAP